MPVLELPTVKVIKGAAPHEFSVFPIHEDHLATLIGETDNHNLRRQIHSRGAFNGHLPILWKPTPAFKGDKKAVGIYLRHYYKGGSLHIVYRPMDSFPKAATLPGNLANIMTKKKIRPRNPW